MKKNIIIALLIFCCTDISCAQDKTSASKMADDKTEKPKLVVGIVVDQMKYEYIDRYWNKFRNNGFKRLVNEGTFFRNCNYSYVPTETAPGHASIYTGTTPSVHGIIANGWYNTAAKKSISSVQSGNDSDPLSPNNLLVETVTDRFKNAIAGARVYSISIKDRASILPGGKKADAAFWYDDFRGKFISSDYYAKEKTGAKWVVDFNSMNYPKQFLKNGWKLVPNHSYEFNDTSKYEGKLGIDSVTYFPYRFDSTRYSDIKYTSWGNTLIEKFAEQAVINEKLGQTKAPDFLCVSFSCTDYVGHKFGINSVELEQTYIDLDNDIANLLALLDKRIGKGQYLLFLTADHGAVSNPQLLHDKGEQGGIILMNDLKAELKNLAGDAPGKDSLLIDIGSDQLYFNHDLIKARNLNEDSLYTVFTDFLTSQDGIAMAFTANEIKNNNYTYGIKLKVKNGYNASRSSDIQFITKSNWIIWYSRTGTTHGSPYEYDSHVPLIFYGWNIKNASSQSSVYIQDIAPTVSALLHIELPHGSTGKPIQELLK